MVQKHTLTGNAPIPYQTMENVLAGIQAQRARKMESIYHKGQEKIWDGREVLDELISRHGGIQVEPRHKTALTYLLSLIMWGEYAAWRVAAQLSDRLVQLEARMAATSQAHDEARHFYVLHDYIHAMGSRPVLPRRWGKDLIEMTLKTEDISFKLLGMQLMIESAALAIFNSLKESRIEPVLADLMPYYERDEARHVGLGTQLLPVIRADTSRLNNALYNGFLLRLYITQLNELKELEGELSILGINPRKMILVSKDRQFQIFREILAAGGERQRVNVVAGVAEALIELYFPEGPRRGTLSRAVHLGRATWTGLQPVDKRPDYHPTLRFDA